MYDFISHSGLSVVSRRVFEFLDVQSLKVASEVSLNWHDVIAQDRSLWLRHFKIFRRKKEIGRQQLWKKQVHNIPMLTMIPWIPTNTSS